jgi:hypothetical protein
MSSATAKGTLIRVMTRRRRGNDFFDSRNHHIFRRSLSAKVYQPQGVVTTIRGIRHRNKRSSPGLFLQDYRETFMPWPSNKMRELRTALALALGLAIAAFGTAIVAAPYIAK